MYLPVMTVVIFIYFVFSEMNVFSSANYIRNSPHNNPDHSASNDNNYKINLDHLGNRIYGAPTKNSGVRVAKWHQNFSVNPEELGDYAEGDILFSNPTAKSALAPEYYRWPGGRVPYTITGYFTSEEQAQILSAIDDFHKYTCVRFVPHNGETAYIRITSKWAGCFSTVGYGGFSYDVNLQAPQCLQMKGTILHELMHVLGFIHEHTRYDRDNYIYILWNNIHSDAHQNFKKYAQEDVNTFGVPYDFNSVMHYSRNAFSINGGDTIVPKFNTAGDIGIRENFSQGDVDKINKMYQCIVAPQVQTVQNSTPVYLMEQQNYIYSPRIIYYSRSK